MRTVRWSRRLMGGGVCLRGVHLPTDRILDTRCENISFPQLRLRTVNKAVYLTLYNRYTVYLPNCEQLNRYGEIYQLGTPVKLLRKHKLQNLRISYLRVKQSENAGTN